MRIAIALALLLLITSTSYALGPDRDVSRRPSPPSRVPMLPPLDVDVEVADGVPLRLVRDALQETDAVWRGFLRCEWHLAASDWAAGRLHVLFDDERGQYFEAERPIGWITFAAPNQPGHELHVSRANAEALLVESASTTGDLSSWPPARRRVMLSRALGRALAHEMGHYLLESKLHASDGLMRTHRSAGELFGADRGRFSVRTEDRQAILRRFERGGVATAQA